MQTCTDINYSGPALMLCAFVAVAAIIGLVAEVIYLRASFKKRQLNAR